MENSIECSNEIDFAALNDSLDKALDENDVTEEGTMINPPRHNIYKDYFDEVILQLSTVNIHEATLLGRIRDEFSATSDAYKKLYESSVAFGLSKAIAMRKENEKLHSRIDELLNEKIALFDENEFLKRKLNAVAKEEERKRELETRRYKLELRRLKVRNDSIKRGLETCLVDPNACDEVNLLLESNK